MLLPSSNCHSNCYEKNNNIIALQSYDLHYSNIGKGLELTDASNTIDRAIVQCFYTTRVGYM